METGSVHDTARSLATTRALKVAQASVLRLVCGLGLANAALMVVVTVIARPTGFGIVVAVTWLAVWGLLLDGAETAQAWFARRPVSLVAMAAIGMAPVALDGGLEGTLTTQALWLTWVAAVTVSARMTLATAGAMSAAAAMAMALSGMGPHDLFVGSDRFQVTLLICTPLVAALVGLAVVGVFRTVLAGADDTLAAIAAGARASTPALGQLLHRHSRELLGAGTSNVGGRFDLTETEAEIVALLRGGRTPQQIALDRGRSIHTVRTQIKHAKRKVGARTINELITRTWPVS